MSVVEVLLFIFAFLAFHLDIFWLSKDVLNVLVGGKEKWRARWDLNPGPPAPQASVIIRTRLRAHTDRLRYYCIPKYEVFSLRNSFVLTISKIY